MLLFFNFLKSPQTLTKDVIRYGIHILFTFLVKVGRGLRKISSVAYHKSFFKNKIKIMKI